MESVADKASLVDVAAPVIVESSNVVEAPVVMAAPVAVPAFKNFGSSDGSGFGEGREHEAAATKKDFEEVEKKWTKIKPEHWKESVAQKTSKTFMEKSHRRKEMHSKNKYDHHLESHGYIGKRRIWDKKDTTLPAAGKSLLFQEIKEEHSKNWTRACTTSDPKTGEPILAHPELQGISKRLIDLSQQPGGSQETSLSKALQMKEKTGCVRGVEGEGGGGVAQLKEDTLQRKRSKLNSLRDSLRTP